MSTLWEENTECLNNNERVTDVVPYKRAVKKIDALNIENFGNSLFTMNREIVDTAEYKELSLNTKKHKDIDAGWAWVVFTVAYFVYGIVSGTVLETK